MKQNNTNESFYNSLKYYKDKRLVRGKAIRLYCKMQCCAGDTKSWQNCSITNCFLWPFRMGKEIIRPGDNNSKAIHKSGHFDPQNTSQNKPGVLK